MKCISVALPIALATALGGFFPPAFADRTVTFPREGTPVGNALTYPFDGGKPLNMIGSTRGKITIRDGWALYVIATPEGMSSFNVLTKLKPGELQRLRIHDVPISKENLQAFGKLNGLTWLDLSYSDSTDEVFGYAAAIKTLEKLDVSSTHIHGSGFSKLKTLKRLVDLDLADTGVRDSALDALITSCPQLEELTLTNTLITDNAIPKLLKLRHLQRLRLIKDNITDKYIDKLLTLKDLKKLSLSGTRVSAEKLESLRKAKPGCKFVFKSRDD